MREIRLCASWDENWEVVSFLCLLCGLNLSTSSQDQFTLPFPTLSLLQEALPCYEKASRIVEQHDCPPPEVGTF